MKEMEHVNIGRDAEVLKGTILGMWADGHGGIQIEFVGGVLFTYNPNNFNNHQIMGSITFAGDSDPDDSWVVAFHQNLDGNCHPDFSGWSIHAPHNLQHLIANLPDAIVDFDD
jgi:hypothetical protein